VDLNSLSAAKQCRRSEPQPGCEPHRACGRGAACERVCVRLCARASHGVPVCVNRLRLACVRTHRGRSARKCAPRGAVDSRSTCEHVSALARSRVCVFVSGSPLPASLESSGYTPAPGGGVVHPVVQASSQIVSKRGHSGASAGV
jgi:hypothetical protein